MHPSVRAELERIVRFARRHGAELDELLELVREVFAREVTPVTPAPGDVLPGPPAAAQVARPDRSGLVDLEAPPAALTPSR